MSKRGDRIIERQRQCGGCQFEGSEETEGRSYGFCIIQKKRFCDMSIYEDCKYFKPKRTPEADKSDFSLLGQKKDTHIGSNKVLSQG